MFIENLILNLKRSGFYEISDTNIYFKNVKNIGYFVCPLDAESDLSLYYDNFFPIVEQLRVDKIYFLYIISGSDFKNNYMDLINKDIDLDARMVKLYWGVDTSSKKMIINKNQPSKLVNIEDYVKSSLMNEKSVIKPINSEVICNIPYASYFLIAILIIIHFAVNKNIDDVIFTFGLSPNMLDNGEYYRLITSTFLHVNIQHLISNCLSLYIFGTKVERYMGIHFFIITYILAGLCGSILSMMFTKSFSVGASGAIFGMEGALLYFAIKEQTYIDGLDVQTIFIIVFIGLMFGFATANVDNAGHIGGFILGIVASLIQYKSIKV